MKLPSHLLRKHVPTSPAQNKVDSAPGGMSKSGGPTGGLGSKVGEQPRGKKLGGAAAGSPKANAISSQKANAPERKSDQFSADLPRAAAKKLSVAAPAVNLSDLERQVAEALENKDGRGLAALSDDALQAASFKQKTKLVKTCLNAKFSLWNRVGLGKLTGTQSFDHNTLLKRVLQAMPHPDALDVVINKIGTRSFRTSLRRTLDVSSSKVVDKLHSRIKVGDWQAFSKSLTKVTGAVGSSSKATLFMDSDVVPQLVKDIKGAKSSIDMQLYIAHDDNVGNQVLDALMQKAKSGVQVRVLLDGFGSKGGEEKFQKMRDAGVDVILNPAPLLKDHLDHRKIWVMDGKVGFTGGANLGKKYHEEWNDHQTRMEGPAVNDMQKIFDDAWKTEGGKAGSFDGQDRATEIPDSNGTHHVVQHLGQFADENIKMGYLRAIRTSSDTIQIANPYFTDKDIVDALCQAAKRGVKVEVMLPRENDVELIRDAGRVHYDVMMDAGIDVLEFTGRMSHLKVAVFDSKACTFGSSNLDARSLEYNDECNVFSVCESTSKDLQEQVFDANRPHCVNMKNESAESVSGVYRYVLEKAMDFL